MAWLRVLTVNAGSSSVKLHLIDGDDTVVDSTSAAFDPERGTIDEVVDAIDRLGAADIVGHRVVHGGPHLTLPSVIDDGMIGELRALEPLAPLHQRTAIALIEAVREARPDAASVACFDTAFHATLPPAASTYAIPTDWRSRLGVRRYGFHGLSHSYASRRSCEMTRRVPELTKVIVCHLGAGASVCAVQGGRSVDTSMGFTPLEGLVMATRSGTVDPGALLWLLDNEPLSASEVADALEHDSGLLALAGTADMREIVERGRDGDPPARLAFDVFVHRLRREIGAMAAVLGGVDVLVFTGGIGEHSPAVREAACASLGHLGVELEPGANRAADGDADISTPSAAARTVVVSSREDLAIASAARHAVATTPD